jgi:acetyl esterase/lipase
VCRKLVIDGALPLLMPVNARAAPFSVCTSRSFGDATAGTARHTNGGRQELVYVNGLPHVSVSIKPSDQECSSYCGQGYVAPAQVQARLISHRALQGQEPAEERARESKQAAGGAAGASGSSGSSMSSMPMGLLGGNMPSMTWKNKECADTSPFLIIHFHGGGFIAQSSASHEAYLRDWAKELNAPILSVDYDLAPVYI